MRHDFTVTPADAGRRLDRFVQAALGGVPGGLVQKLLRKGKVRVGGVKRPGSHRLAEGDEVVVHHSPRPADRAPEPSRLPRYDGPPIGVLLEDDHFLFVDKPAGVACSDDGRDAACLPAWLRQRWPAAFAAPGFHPEPAHRLDRGTTGVVVVARTAAAATAFREASEAGRVEKCYRVAAWGGPPGGELEVELPLRRVDRPRAGEPKVIAAAADEEGAQAARTHFRVLSCAGQAHLLEARLGTGRTHQVRAHCLAQGWPVVGDRRYGDRELDDAAGLAGAPGHPLLHAAGISSTLLGVDYRVEAPLPAGPSRVLQKLGLEIPGPDDRPPALEPA